MTAPNNRWFRICECGKRSYRSRKDGRRAARMINPGDPAAAYECLMTAGQWHIGHLPPAVVSGLVGRPNMPAPRVSTPW